MDKNWFKWNANDHIYHILKLLKEKFPLSIGSKTAKIDIMELAFAGDFESIFDKLAIEEKCIELLEYTNDYILVKKLDNFDAIYEKYKSKVQKTESSNKKYQIIYENRTIYLCSDSEKRKIHSFKTSKRKQIWECIYEHPGEALNMDFISEHILSNLSKENTDRLDVEISNCIKNKELRKIIFPICSVSEIKFTPEFEFGGEISLLTSNE